MKTHIRLIITAAAITIFVTFPILLRPISEIAQVVPSKLAQPNSQNSEAATHESDVPNREFSGYTWREGMQAEYSFHAQLLLGSPKAIPGAGLELDGRYQIRVLLADGDEVLIGAMFTAAHVRRDGIVQPKMAALFQSTPCLLSFRRNGQITVIRFPAETAASDRAILHLGFGWEFAVEPAPSWTSEEYTSDGGSIFHCTYAHSIGHIEKVRRFVGRGNTGGEQRVLSSSFFGVPGSVWLSSLSGGESCSLRMSDSDSIETYIGIRIKCESSSDEPTSSLATYFRGDKDALLSRFTLSPTGSSQISVTRQLEDDALKLQYGSTPFAQILTQITEASRTATLDEKIPAMQSLSEWLRVHPEGSIAMISTLRTAVEPDLTGMLVHGLAGRTDDLAELLENPKLLSNAALVQAIVEAGACESATPRIVNAIDNLLAYEQPEQAGAEGDDFSVNDAALLNLGRLAKKDPALKNALLHKLLPRIRDGNDADRAVAIMSLENAGLENPVAFAGARSDNGTKGSESE